MAEGSADTDLRVISAEVDLLLSMAVILVAATIGKYLGCGLTVRRQGYAWRYASAVGGLMHARG